MWVAGLHVAVDRAHASVPLLRAENQNAHSPTRGEGPALRDRNKRGPTALYVGLAPSSSRPSRQSRSAPKQFAQTQVSSLAVPGLRLREAVFPRRRLEMTLTTNCKQQHLQHHLHQPQSSTCARPQPARSLAPSRQSRKDEPTPSPAPPTARRHPPKKLAPGRQSISPHSHTYNSTSNRTCASAPQQHLHQHSKLHTLQHPPSISQITFRTPFATSYLRKNTSSLSPTALVLFKKLQLRL